MYCFELPVPLGAPGREVLLMDVYDFQQLLKTCAISLGQGSLINSRFCKKGAQIVPKVLARGDKWLLKSWPGELNGS
jgi:hypothetical protein